MTVLRFVSGALVCVTLASCSEDAGQTGGSPAPADQAREELPADMRKALRSMSDAQYTVRASQPHHKEVARLVLELGESSRVILSKSRAARPVNVLAKPRVQFVSRCGPYTAFGAGTRRAETIAMKVMGIAGVLERSACKPHYVLE